MSINVKFGFDQFDITHKEGIFKGCWNACRYCGVKKTQCVRLKRRDPSQWDLMVLNKPAFKAYIGKRKGRTVLFTPHDIFPFNKGLCFSHIKRVLHPSAETYNKVMVISKPYFSVFESFCRKFEGYRKLDPNLILLRFTFTTLENDNTRKERGLDLKKFWEEKTTSFAERLKTLRYCHELGWQTSAIIEPFLDNIEDLEELINQIHPHVTEHIWLGHMNRIKAKNIIPSERRYYEDIRKKCHPNNLHNIVEVFKNKNDSRNRKILYKESFLKKHLKGKITIPDFQIPRVKKSRNVD